jgi:hypothetical protein
MIHHLSTFDRLEIAERKLSVPPTLSRIERPEFHGDVVARFVLELADCKPQNRKRHEHPFVAVKRMKALRKTMFIQCSPWRCPLPGRPQVLCVRFSSTEADKYADWAKEAVDVLQVKMARAQVGRLGIIVDDSPAHCDLQQWWEPEKPLHGFVYIEVRTGKS